MALSHTDESGQARMVDVGSKSQTQRVAVASGYALMAPETLRLAQGPLAPKGSVAQTARLAGIMAAKKTSDLIPLCHPEPLTFVGVEVTPGAKGDRLEITATVKTFGRTGVEMEALTAVAVAALTIYDMLKAVDKGIVIGGIALLEKTGGKSGPYARQEGRPE